MIDQPPTVAPGDGTPDAPLLAVSHLTVCFGGITALDDVSFEVGHGEICGLIGPNGAGKTTVFNCLGRLYDPSAGDILFDGRSLLALRPDQVAGRGLARTFQNLALFERLSVMENVLAGGHVAGTHGALAEAFGTRAARAGEARLRDRAREWLELVGLGDRADAPVAGLPFGSRKRVELARALMSEPRLLLLDEPAGGLALEEVERLDVLIREVRDRLGITILLVEHRMGFVMAICDRLVVLDFGRVIAAGAPAAVAEDAAVVDAYLGVRA